ncbi:MAG TPA: hypothetical protein VG365_10275 [Solirubrobacteraceae bacterium]|nr:hypothetical protein [Solirubrobacteraceae bacterium]
MPGFDVITTETVGVDLYPQQTGVSLAEMPKSQSPNPYCDKCFHRKLTSARP